MAFGRVGSGGGDVDGEDISPASVDTPKLFTESGIYDAIVWTDGGTYYAVGRNSLIDSGNDAPTVLQSALDHPVDDNRDVGRVAVAKGTYPIGTTVDVREGVKADISEGAVFEADADVDLFNFLPDSQWSGGAINCDTGVGFTSSAVVHEGTDSGAVQHGPRNTTTVENLFIQLPTTSGTGVHLRTSAVDLNHVTWTTHRNVSVFQGSKCFHLDNPDTTDIKPYTNANFFDTCWTFNSEESFVIDGPGDSDAAGNRFSGCQVQANADSTRAFEINGNGNIFDGCFVWDWSQASTSISVNFSGGTQKNRWYGQARRSDIDNSGRNNVNGYASVGTSPGNSAVWQGYEQTASNLGVVIWDTSTSPATGYRAFGGSFIQIT